MPNGADDYPVPIWDSNLRYQLFVLGMVKIIFGKYKGLGRSAFTWFDAALLVRITWQPLTLSLFVSLVLHICERVFYDTFICTSLNL